MKLDNMPLGKPGKVLGCFIDKPDWVNLETEAEMTRWRKIETEGLPKEFVEVIWLTKSRVMKIASLYLDKVTLRDSWQPVTAFTHWTNLPKPPKE